MIDAAKATDGVPLEPVSHNAYPPREDGGLNPSGVLRRALDLFANIRPARRWEGCDAPARGPVDLVVVRENLEGFYADRNLHLGLGKFMAVPGVAIRRVTEHASRRISEAAFKIAADRSARRVTAIHKANVMRMSDELFLDTARRVAAEYPEIAHDEMLVDATAAYLVRDAGRFDMIVTNQYVRRYSVGFVRWAWAWRVIECRARPCDGAGYCGTISGQSGVTDLVVGPLPCCARDPD